MTAFSSAILDQIASPDKNIFYNLVCEDYSTACSARDYLNVRDEEGASIRSCLAGFKSPKILDIGACVGRHSRLALAVNPACQISIVEKDEELRQFCSESFFIVNKYNSVEEINDFECFDLIFLCGLGLGIFGDEISTRLGLIRLFSLLAPGGKILVEGGKSSPEHFSTRKFSINYNGNEDPSFLWGYATFEWFRKFKICVPDMKIIAKARSNIGDSYYLLTLQKNL